MAFNVNEIRSQLTLGGARGSLFQVTFSNPANSIADIKVPFMVRTAQLPESTLGTIEVPYFGRKIRLAGDRSFSDWTVTVINDEDFLIRNALEEWSQRISGHQSNLRAFGSASPLLYKSTAEVTQFSKTGVPIRTYRFNGIFPTSISSIDLNWGDVDSIEEFSVTFQYDWWEVSGGITGDAGTTA
jgi:T4-like virus tail tube protein gp19